MKGKRQVLAALLVAAAARAQPPPPPPVISGPTVLGPVTPRLSRSAARDLPRLAPGRPLGPVRIVPRRRPGVPLELLPAEVDVDPVVQRRRGAARAPDVLITFEGVSATNAVPPDTVGDVGPSHYVQMVNTVFQIWDKTGNVLAGPSSINSLWAGQPGSEPCETQNAGDPIVLYDPLADRWLISQFAFPASQCIAVSTGADPTGTYHLYEFDLGDFPDYPKFGVWPDAYVMGANSNPRAFAFDRARMLDGLSAAALQFNVAGVGFHSLLLPADLDGAAPPPGAKNPFYRFVDGDVFGGVDRIELFELTPDFDDPPSSTFTGPTALPVAAFASLCGFSFDCIVQKGTTRRLDSITEWPMFRFQYRNFGSHETLIGNHSVNVGGDQAGVRWFELRRGGGGGWSIHQQGTWAPDGDSRWMGSIAMDGLGNVGLGYNVSSAATFPSIRFTGRLAGDAAGLMTLGEGVLAAGGGSQTGSNRWGDYSALSVDPADDCTFWFTGEYYDATSSAGWKTRIGSFRLCGAPPEVTIRSPPDGSTINQADLIGFLGAAVDVPDGDLTAGLSWQSDLDGAIGAGGQFQTNLSLGSHTVTASVSDSDLEEGSAAITLEIVASGCSDHVALNQEIDGPETVQARFTISTWPGFSVVAGGDADLEAGEAVVLRDGSSIEETGTLKASNPAGVCP